MYPSPLTTTWITGEPQSTTVFQPSFLIDRQVTEHADVFAEYIGDYQTRGSPGQQLNFGGSYRLTQTQQVDFHAGFGLNRNSPDYFVGIGYSLRRQLGKRNFSAFLSQTVTYPERSNIGFELEPRALQSINFSYYQQNGVTSLITTQTPGEELFSSTRGLTSVQPLGNRSGFSLNFSRRF